MKKYVILTRTVICVLSFALGLTSISVENMILAWADVKNGNTVKILADSESTITVNKKDEDSEEPGKEPDIEPGKEPDNDILKIVSDKFSIERDYEQKCIIRVQNTSDHTQQIYLEAENPYKDLSMEIIRTGSKSSPVILGADESVEIELSVFAQNALQEQYTIPVSGYILTDEEYKKNIHKNITLECTLPGMALVWEKLSENAATLAQEYQITNQGDMLNDLVVTASDSLAEYISFDPIVSNYQLYKGESVKFTVHPDLAKMKNAGITVLTGQLIAVCAGKTSTFECSIDTKGQEITLTTMGKLALKQNGYQFSKFEVDQTSVFLQYNNGTGFEDAGNNSDFLRDDSTVHVKSGIDIDIGMEKPLKLNSELQAKEVSENMGNENFNVSSEWKENGLLRVSVKLFVSESEYQEFVSKVKPGTSSRKKNFLQICAEGDDIPESAKQRVIELTFDFNDAAVFFGNNLETIDALKQIYLLCSMDERIKEVYSMSNPYISSTQKIDYMASVISKDFLENIKDLVDPFSPGIGFLLELINKDLQNKLTLWQEEYDISKKQTDYVVNYDKVVGHQCTNRGLVQTSFYVPSYNSKERGSANVSMYATNRLYANGYVNMQNTNYDIILNGQTVKKVNVSGLTQTVITEVPSDYLKPGMMNTLVFDYDTSPGSHFVTTDTNISFLYPRDTEIGYIGTPDMQQEVRALPDFAIYPENIYTDNEVMQGENTKLKFNVYNLGSDFGWFTITVYNGDNVIFQKENNYLDAFGSETFMAAWVPESDNNKIRIVLNNTTEDVEELDTGNNLAEKIIQTYQMQIPVIGELNVGTIYEQRPYSMILDISDSADVEGIKFIMDGTEINYGVKTSGDDRKKRYLLNSKQGLTAGEHQLLLSVRYKTSNGIETLTKEFQIDVQEKEITVPYIYSRSEGTLLYDDVFSFSVANIENLKRTELQIDNEKLINVDPVRSEEKRSYYDINTREIGAGSHDVNIKLYYSEGYSEELCVENPIEVRIASEEESYLMFDLDETVADPVFYISDGEDTYTQRCEKLEGQKYRLKKNLDMLENPKKYYFYIRHNAGIFMQNLSQNQQSYSTQGCPSVTFEKNGDLQNAEITEMKIYTAGDVTVNIPLQVSDTLYLSQGIYNLRISGRIGNGYFNRAVDIDVTNGNQTVAMEDLFFSYYFKITGTQTKDWFAYLCYRQQGKTVWNYENMSTVYDAHTGLLKCFIAYADDSEIEQAEEAMIVVYSRSEIFNTPIDVTKLGRTRTMRIDEEEILDNYAALDRGTLNKVYLKCTSEGVKAVSVGVGTKLFYVNLYADTVYLPANTYVLRVTLSTGNQNMTVTLRTQVNHVQDIIVDKEIENYVDIKINWAQQFNRTGTVSSTTPLGGQIYASDFVSGNILKTESGKQTLRASLRQGKYRFTVTKDAELAANNPDMQIGNIFKGKITNGFSGSYLAEKAISISVANLQDENGNTLTDFYGSGNSFKGTAVFTDINDENRKFTMPVTASSAYSIRTTLPEEAGTYKVSVELYTDESDSDKQKLVESLLLKMDKKSVVNGNTLQIMAEIQPEDAENKKLNWYTDDASVATVNQDGLVKAVGIGKAMITAKTTDGSNIKASCVISVEKGLSNNPDYGHGGSNGSGGSYYPGGSVTPGNDNKKPDQDIPGDDDKKSDSDDLTVKILYYIVAFDANGGTKLSRKNMTLLNDDYLGILPKVQYRNYTFDGWFTQKSGGEKVSSNSVFNAATTLYAHWTKTAKPARAKIAALKSVKRGQVTVSMKKVKGAKGYEIHYSTDKKFKAKTVKKVTANAVKKTLIKLKSGKKYYVRVRAYKQDSTGKKVYGAYSAAKKVSVK